MLSTAELTAMRAEVERTFVLSGTITRITKSTTTADTSGFPVPAGTVGTITNVVPCALAKASDRSRIEAMAGREAEKNYYKLTLKWDADIMPDDKVVIEADSYAVVNLYDDHIYRVARRAIVTKID